MHLYRRRLVAAAALIAVLSLTASAEAIARNSVRSTHLRGVVVKINVSRHLLRLRLLNGHHRQAGARAAPASDGNTVTISYRGATVEGNLRLGDDVTVTTTGTPGAPVASTIQVTAEPQGGGSDSGSSGSGGSSSGGNDSSSGGGQPSYAAFDGTVSGLAQGGIVVSVAPGWPLAGQSVTVDVSAATHYKGVTGIGDVKVGDEVRVYSTSLDPRPIIAVFLGDGPSAPSGSTGDSGTTPPSPSPPAAVAGRFGGTVTAVRGDGLTVTVTSGGSLSGKSVIVAVPPSTTFVGVSALSDVAVGDLVEVQTANEAATPVVAASVSLDGTG